MRATVKLTTGSLAVFSPVNLTPEVRAKVDAMGGNVKYIAAPDLQHHLHITAWKKAFPHAEILAPEGLWEKRQSVPEFKDTPFQHVWKKDELPPTISEEWDAEFETEYVHGHGSRELVFLHKPSRTVIEADLLFNLPANEQYSKTDDKEPLNFATKMVLPLLSAKTHPATGQRRFAWYILSANDRAGFTTSVRQIMRWDFDRVIPCHGDVIETNARSVFQNVMAWFLKEDQKHV